MVKVCLVFCLLFLFSLKSNAQAPQKKLDSVLSIHANYHKDDSVKLKNLKEVYRQYMRMKNVPKVEEYVGKTVALAIRLNLRRFEAEAYYRRGVFYHGTSNYEKAEESYLKSVRVYALLNDLDWVGGVYLNLGALYTGIPDYAKALEVNQKAISVFQKNGNEEDLASCYANISSIYLGLNQQSNSLFYLKKALQIFEKEGENSRGVAVVTNSIGNAYFDASNEELVKMGVNPNQKNKVALAYYSRSLKAAIAIGDDGVEATANRNLGKLYELIGNRTLALQAYETAIAKDSVGDDMLDYAFSLLALGKFYEGEKEFDKSINLVLKALKIGEDNKLLEIQRNAYEYLSSVEEKKGNYSLSLANYKKFIDFKEQIFNEEKEKEVTRRQLQINFAVKEKDYQLKQELTDGALQRQVLLAKQQQQKLILRQQALDLSDKEKRLQRLTFLKKQADLENEKRFQQGMRVSEQLKSKLDKEIKDREINFQKSELKFNKNITLFLSILAVILFGSAVAVFLAQRKTAKLNTVVSNQKAELEKLGKVKDRIFSVVGHDMRSPVNSLISFIQLLEDGNMEPQKLNRYAGHLKNTLTYTSAMMENLLNWASSQMEGFKPIIEPFKIKACVQEVVDSLADLAFKKKIQINNNLLEDKYCLADINMTTIVFRNLINNAIKFTNEGGSIHLSMQENNHELLIAVKDNGIGLTQEQIDNFNESGSDSNSKTTLGTNSEKGTGIGLLLCKTFTQLMNGLLQVQSKKNIGTTFTLTLPKPHIS
ncbi:tetratricopeptide repeat protein [Pedobacter sp. Du54]|uniref:tetratricopeptide repeat-containing sensor histidine kinase n=1 Tax=Pedobacter anseongensis TaxID=3133439 RepID=UPI003097786D